MTAAATEHARENANQHREELPTGASQCTAAAGRGAHAPAQPHKHAEAAQGPSGEKATHERGRAGAKPAGGHKRSIQYMPALDGLRAFAVLAVIAYHMGLTWAQGGLLGVTVFFVLSGFLITKLLLVETSTTGRIDFKNFYLRRVRRLVPAIVVVIVGVAALCTLFNHPLLTKMRPDVLPSLLFFNNWWQIFHNVSYFQALGAPSPLTHFWSLAIEEQFYLVWPLLLLCAMKLGAKRKHLRAGIAVLAVASALEMALLYDPSADPSRLYYGTDTRAFALLIGAFLATSTSGRRPRTTPALRDGLAAAAFAGLVLMVVFTNGFTAFPYYGGLVLCSVLSALFIYGTAAPDSRTCKRIFSAKPLVWVGERSYGMYLWHYPIILLTTPINAASAAPWWLHLVQLALILGVSAFSFRFIETPIRRGALGRAWKEWRKRRAELAEQRMASSNEQNGAQDATQSNESDANEQAPETTLAAAAEDRAKGAAAEASPDKSSTLAHDAQEKAAHGAATLWHVTVRAFKLNPKKATGTAVAAATLAIAIFGLVCVPDTSALSEEGAAVLEQGGQAVSAPPSTGTTPEEEVAQADAEAAKAQQEAIDAAVASAIAAPADEHDARTPEQRGFDARLAHTPLPEGAAPIIMIGDSVSLRAVPTFQEAFPAGIVNAEQSRQLEAGVAVYSEYAAAGQVGNVVVFSLGTNGFLTDERIDAAMAAAGPDKAVWFLTVRSPFNSPEITNDALARALERYPNLRLIDWASASEGHAEYFDGDGTHLTDEGAQVFIGLIQDAVKYALPVEPEPTASTAE